MVSVSKIDEWRYDSSVNVHVCNDKSLYTDHEVVNGREVLMDNNDLQGDTQGQY